MKKYILLVIALCVCLASCNREPFHPSIIVSNPLCGLRFVVIDEDGNNILAKDIEDLGNFTVEFGDWEFNMKIENQYDLFVGRKEEYGPYRLLVYPNILSYDNGKIKVARFCWSEWWGDYQTFKIKYCDCEWNVVCDARIDNDSLMNYECDAVWIDDVESEQVYMGTTSKGEQIWAYELRMK